MLSRPLSQKMAIALFLAWLAASGVTAFFGLPALWGLIPAGKAVGAVLLVWSMLCLALLFGLEGGLAGRWLQRAGDFLTRSRPALRYAALGTVAGGLFLLGWSFRSENFFMGDGWMYLNVVTQPFHLIPDRPLDYLAHHLSYYLLGQLGHQDAELSYAILHCVLFPFFVLALWSLAGRIATGFTARFALTLILAGTSALQLFCGHVESYTVLAFFATLYLAAGAAYAIRRGELAGGLPWAASLLYFCAFLSHRSAVVLAPSLLFLWLLRLMRTDRCKPPLNQFYIILSLSPLPLVAALLLKSASLSLLVPLVNNNPGETPYTLFSSGHLFEKLNFILLISPSAVIAAPALVAGWNSVRKKMDSLFLFLSLAALGSLFFLLVLNPMLGLRDWDLLSLCAVPSAAWAGWVLHRVFEEGVSRRGNPLLALGLGLAFHGALWVWINSDIFRGVAYLQRVRFEDQHTSTGKANLAKELLDQGFIRESIEQNRLADGKMNLRGIVNLAQAFMFLGMPDSTLYYTRKALDFENRTRLKPTATVWIRMVAAFDALDMPDSANYYYLGPLRDNRVYYDGMDRGWYIMTMGPAFTRYMNRAIRDQMDLGCILFFLRYNSLAGREDNLAKTYNFYKTADFSQEQWKRLLDFAIVSRHYEYVDTLKSHAYSQFPELQDIFGGNP